jgi:isoprenylcysteine carboxyl methyltransferase (ICMT) family protein YpbQ
VLLLGSIPLAGHAIYLLRRTGMPKGSIETTTELVTGGVFRYIRHPLYASLILLGWGSALKYLSWPSLGLACAGTLLFFLDSLFLRTRAARSVRSVVSRLHARNEDVPSVRRIEPRFERGSGFKILARS